MGFLNQITSLVKDPPPRHLFELSEAGIAFAHAGNIGFQPFEPGTLVASPVEDNVLRATRLRRRSKGWRPLTARRSGGQRR